jgi:hypothetical protein
VRTVPNSRLLFLLVLWFDSAAAATLRVPSEHATINGALDASVAGDTVLVAPGTYSSFEVRQVFGQVASQAFMVGGVSLLSEGGAGVTTLDLSMSGGLAGFVAGIYVESLGAAGATIRGFSLVDAPVSGAVSVHVGATSNVEISDCVFRLDDPASGTSVDRGSVQLIGADAVIEGCRFSGLRGPTGAGLGQGYGMVEVNRCVFERCENEAIRVGSAQFTTVRDCVFDSNATSVSCAAGICDIGPGLIENCVFIGNDGIGYAGAVTGGNLTVRGCLFDSNHVAGTAAALSVAGNSNLIENNTIVNSSQSISTSSGSAIVVAMVSSSYITTLRNNIIAFSSGSPAVEIGRGKIASDCNVFWMNADGISDGSYVLSATDRIVDPLFCNPDAGDWTLQQHSPCLPTDPSGCGQIGAFGQGCGAVSVESRSWGKIKGFYRGDPERGDQ